MYMFMYMYMIVHVNVHHIQSCTIGLLAKLAVVWLLLPAVDKCRFVGCLTENVCMSFRAQALTVLVCRVCVFVTLGRCSPCNRALLLTEV